MKEKNQLVSNFFAKKLIGRNLHIFILQINDYEFEHLNTFELIPVQYNIYIDFLRHLYNDDLVFLHNCCKMAFFNKSFCHLESEPALGFICLRVRL